MGRVYSGFFLLWGGMIATSLLGCSQQAAPNKAASNMAAAEAAQAEAKEAAEIAAAIAELPEAERPVAAAQKICPVGGGALGTMGMPYKVTVKGRDVYLCCEGCKGAIEKDPDQYLAKLDAQAK